MLDRITGKPVHAYIQFIACIAIAVGLPWSKVPVSLAVALLGLNFLLRGDFGDVYKNLKKKKALLFFLLYIAFEFCSLLWSDNIKDALSAIVVRLPFYVIPILIVAKPLENRKQLQWVGLAFVLACFVTSFFNIGSYLHWWGNREYDDIRGLSLFISHIRYALIIALASVFCLAWFIYKLPYRYLSLPLLGWFAYYTYFAQVLTGYMAFGICLLVVIIFFYSLIKSRTVKYTFGVLAGIAIVFFGVWAIKFIQPEQSTYSVQNLPKFTVNGRPYNRIEANDLENGKLIYACCNTEEIEKEWPKRSDKYIHKFDTLNGVTTMSTLLRYMTSKNLTKDSLGIWKLSTDDIRNIEKGIPSVELLKGGLESRLYTLRFQLEHNSDPNGHSLLQRLEYWKAARKIASKNWLLGVGMGDVGDAFNNYYHESNTKLHEENRFRAHQMYLTTIISSGIFAFAAFILWWFAQIRVAIRIKSLTWICFIAITLSSFFIEDTLETQAGGVFVSFFFALYIAHPRWFISKRQPKTVVQTD